MMWVAMSREDRTEHHACYAHHIKHASSYQNFRFRDECFGPSTMCHYSSHRVCEVRVQNRSISPYDAFQLKSAVSHPDNSIKDHTTRSTTLET